MRPEVLELIVASVTDVIMLVDRDERIVFVNWTLPGYTVEEVTGRQLGDYVTDPEHCRVMRDAFRRVYSSGQPDRYEVEAVLADGTRSYWESRVFPVVEDGEIDRLVIITSNVTDLRHASADRTRFFQLSLDLLCVLKGDGSIQRVNAAFTQILGHPEAEVIGRRLTDFLHDDDVKRTEAFLQRLGTDVLELETRVRPLEGAYRTLQWRAVELPGDGLIYAAGRDVTDHRKLELQLRQSQKMDAIGKLAGGVAHDFNNLVLAILINADEALRESPQAAEPVSEIKRAAQRAAELTKQLLAFSRQQPIDLASVDANEVVRGMVAMLRRTIPPHVRVDFLPGKSLPRMRADAGQVEQVLLNLCINARDAMPEGGVLTIETECVVVTSEFCEAHPWAKPGRYVLLSVTDTGTGMGAELRERVFEPFFTTKPPGKGTGLGLATAYGIVERHEGMLHVYSEVGKGSTFKVYIPLAERVAEEVGDKLSAPAVGGEETILIAEDSDSVRRVVVRVLERAGYTVIPTSSGDEALQTLKRTTVDLALIDVVMPGLSGPETGAEIARLYPEVRVLFTSGYSAGDAPSRDVPSEDMLRKPYQPDELLRSIRRALDE